MLHFHSIFWVLSCQTCTGLHNSKSSQGQIDQHSFTAGCKSLFCCDLEEILVWELIFQGWALQHFLQLRKLSQVICCAGLGYLIICMLHNSSYVFWVKIVSFGFKLTCLKWLCSSSSCIQLQELTTLLLHQGFLDEFCTHIVFIKHYV